MPSTVSRERIVSGTQQFQNIEGHSVYVLDGEPLRNSEPVELLLEDGSWLRGTWEWSGQEIRWPGLRFRLGGDAPAYAFAQESSRTAIVALPPNAVLRRMRR
jgi:hypothetical protein